MEEVGELWGFAVVILIVVGIAVLNKLINRSKKGVASRKQDFAGKSEAMFRSMFPDLQPHLHPKAIHAFVKARRARSAVTGAYSWKSPPGFDAASAEVQPEGKGERVRLLDAAGATLATFLFEEHSEGGVLRVGEGKFTANIRDAVPRVRYWHPHREFKWTPDKWTFQSRVADEPIDSDDRGSSWSSSDSSSSSSRAAGTAAAAAGIAGAGGAFDGGGASQGWEGGSGAAASESSGTTATSY